MFRSPRPRSERLRAALVFLGYAIPSLVGFFALPKEFVLPFLMLTTVLALLAVVYVVRPQDVAMAAEASLPAGEETVARVERTPTPQEVEDQRELALATRWHISWFERRDGCRQLAVEPFGPISALWGVGSQGQRVTFINEDWPHGDRRLLPMQFDRDFAPPSRLFLEWRDVLGFHVRVLPVTRTRDYNESSA